MYQTVGKTLLETDNNTQNAAFLNVAITVRSAYLTFLIVYSEVAIEMADMITMAVA